MQNLKIYMINLPVVPPGGFVSLLIVASMTICFCSSKWVGVGNLYQNVASFKFSIDFPKLFLQG